MSRSKNQHVVPSGNKWAVKGENNSKATKITPTKAEAVKVARQISKNQGSELVVHNRDGKISSKDSHGKDQYPPKG